MQRDRSMAVDVISEFLHTGGPPLDADRAAIAIVDVLEREGFNLDRVRDTRGDDEGLCPECQLPMREGEHQMGCSRSPQGEDHEAEERGAAALCRFVFPGYAVNRIAMARAVLAAANDHDAEWITRLPEKQIAVGEGPSPERDTEKP